ncbi:MAG TPA: phosphoribosylanthranilate isomerase, partial [Polyangia bacterium]|nr:phosphoribosylanthranilate isomerase [Polyangia bacterium]
MSVFVKICGVRTLEDALACAEAGADAIGFNFWPGSKRFVSIDAAAEIARALAPGGPRRFGVFVDAPEEEVARVLALDVVHLAQLHGDEPPEYCAPFGERFVKAIRLRDAASLEALDRYGGELALVDADAPGYGGSGLGADRALARAAAKRRKVLLAGGLTPDNVAEAVREVEPFGVDVAGGVEQAPGIKDWKKIAAFV